MSSESIARQLTVASPRRKAAAAGSAGGLVKAICRGQIAQTFRPAQNRNSSAYFDNLAFVDGH